jgi:hypothetical protein
LLIDSFRQSAFGFQPFSNLIIDYLLKANSSFSCDF